jgi:hypothetical protein
VQQIVIVLCFGCLRRYQVRVRRHDVVPRQLRNLRELRIAVGILRHDEQMARLRPRGAGIARLQCLLDARMTVCGKLAGEVELLCDLRPDVRQVAPVDHPCQFRGIALRENVFHAETHIRVELQCLERHQLKQVGGEAVEHTVRRPAANRRSVLAAVLV